MTPTATVPDLDRNALAAAILQPALAYARRRARGRSDLADALQDAATDAVFRAVRRYRPDRGGFRAYAWRGIHRAVAKALYRFIERLNQRPDMQPLDEAACGECEQPPAALHPDTMRILPPEHRAAVELYFIDRRSMADGAARLGITPAAFRARLIAAGEKLAGRPAVAFCKNQHRFKR